MLSLLHGPTLTSLHDSWKNNSFDYMDLCGKLMSLLFNTVSRFLIACHPRSKHLLISWLQLLSAVIFETKKIKSVTVSTFPSLFAMKQWDQMPRSKLFQCWVLSQFFHSSLSPSSRGSLISLHFLPLEWYHLHIWGCWYSSQQSWFQLMSNPPWHFSWCTLHRSWISIMAIHSLDVLLF